MNVTTTRLYTNSRSRVYLLVSFALLRGISKRIAIEGYAMSLECSRSEIPWNWMESGISDHTRETYCEKPATLKLARHVA